METAKEVKEVKVKHPKQNIKPKKKFNVSIELSKIGAAYNEAIDGKIKFGQVKEMLKKLHKEAKKSKK